jgi:RNA polymerase sigma factor (sigma-70 family)
MSTIVNQEEFLRIRLLARGLALGDDADDVVQDAALARLEGKRRTGTDSYVRHSLRLGLLSRIRADQRRRRREAAFAGMEAESGTGQHEVATIALALRDALLKLSTEQRSLLEARFIEGRAPHEIANALDISPEVVRQRIHRALARLQAEFDDAAPKQRRGLLVLAFGDIGRRRKLAVAAGLAAVITIPAVVYGTCAMDPELETETPPASVAASSLVASDASSSEIDVEPAQPIVAASPAPTAPAPVPDRLGAGHLLRVYKDGHAQITREVQASFIECLREYNQTPPTDGTSFSGRSEFRVHMRHDADAGSFVEELEVVMDEASARELATCVRESLPSIRFEDPALVTPTVFRVVIDLDRKRAFAKAELDLSGLPAPLREDAELLDTLGRYLGGQQPPDELIEAVGDFADALADGVIAADELAPETLASLTELAARP